ncbi:hypothetical protein [Ralstonia pickettii]|uniref:Uncharacterized protein n=1 Tax=Ralstonia pickettii TaxID=329 RepID=A0AAW4Q565_RALPI|nr:hypothetical protein [Ralstonia pickettii]MBA9846610.1 hypothetical protein [Ralstonia pickettii]MBA9851895.1 hypothetical protein [Ralstonia pickettii]MBA9919748.1 hypothetical protein [Ralstonia pickettii]MBA9958848.1 hypothetical protein [Ralstonia pickettii]MBA9965037.1 hypothetical protein [Ralstonia pickettii]
MAIRVQSREQAAQLIRNGLKPEDISRWPQIALPQFLLDDIVDQELECLGIRKGHRSYDARRQGLLVELGQPAPTVSMDWGRIIAMHDEADTPPSFSLVFVLKSLEAVATAESTRRLTSEFDAEAIQFAVGKVIEAKFADIERAGAELTEGSYAGEILKFDVLDTRRVNYRELSESLADFVEHYDIPGMLNDESVVVRGSEESARRYVRAGWAA